MKAYFDMGLPLFLSREPRFDGYPVEVDEQVVLAVDRINALVTEVIDVADLAGAPEDTAQMLSQLLEDKMKEILNA
jgi:hypothetical protein